MLQRKQIISAVNCFLYSNSKSGRQSIKEKLAEEEIAPSESSTSPGKLGRIVPSFWSILSKAKMQGVSLHNLSSHDWYVLSSGAIEKPLFFV
jgi:sacsin